MKNRKNYLLKLIFNSSEGEGECKDKKEEEDERGNKIFPHYLATESAGRTSRLSP